jgi:hypothetical protein
VFVGIGILSKEVTLPVVLSIVLLGIITRRVKWTLLWTLLLIVPSMVWQGYTTLTYGENYYRTQLVAVLECGRQQYGTSLYTEMVRMLRALAWALSPLALLCLIVGFLSLSDRRQNLTFYSLLLPALGAYLLFPHREVRMGVVTFYATMPLAGVGLDHIVKSLREKPLIGRVGPKAIWTILYLTHIALSISFAYNYFGAFSPPWNIYHSYIP